MPPADPVCPPHSASALSVPIAAAEEEEDPRCGLLKSHTKDHTAVSVPASTSGDLMLEEPVSDVSYAQPLALNLNLNHTLPLTLTQTLSLSLALTLTLTPPSSLTLSLALTL